MLWLAGEHLDARDNWTRRAVKGLVQSLHTVRGENGIANRERYGNAVRDINRILSVAGKNHGVTAGLADYQDPSCSPHSSADLLASAGAHEKNIFYPWFSRRIPELMDGVRLVGISVNYLNQAVCAFAITGYLKSRFPDVTIVMGGGLVTSWMSRPGWESPFATIVDHMVSGPGEKVICDLAGMSSTCPDHALPDYSDYSLNEYLAPGVIIPYSTSYGCWWRKCSFCPEKAEGNSYRQISPKQALSDLRSLDALYRPRLFHLIDSAVSPSFLKAVASSPMTVPWYGFARFHACLDDPDFCLALKHSGCVMLQLGLESGDQAVLDSLGKGVNLEMASRVLRNLKAAGISVYCYLLFGTPPETEAAARRTGEFVVRHAECLDFLNIAVFNMPAYGEDADRYDTGPFSEGDLSLYSQFRHPAGWDRRQARLFIEREFVRVPVVARIVRKDPPIFKSNHAPFFCGP